MQLDFLTASRALAAAENQVSTGQPENHEELMTAAKNFEASFVAQMLQHSGFADALTTSDSKGAEAFTGFYIEQLSASIVDSGGFGIASSIYDQLVKYQDEAETTAYDKSV